MISTAFYKTDGILLVFMELLANMEDYIDGLIVRYGNDVGGTMDRKS
jgi:hypothetical protein